MTLGEGISSLVGSYHGYHYSLVVDSGFHRRLEYLATFLLDEKIISQGVDVSDVLDTSVITQAVKTWKKTL